MARTIRVALVSLAAIAVAAAARAQDTGFNPVTGPGWNFTPTLTYSGGYDDNPLILGEGDARSDYTSSITPEAALDYTGRRTHLSAGYAGSFLLYRQFNELNAFDQHEQVSVARTLTARTKLSFQQSFSKTPTTELLGLVAVPFVRVGSRLSEIRGGIEMAFTKRTSLALSYDAQWISFNEDPIFNQVLVGGHGQGGTARLKHQMTARLALTGDYDLQHATIVNGGVFNVQNARAGVEDRLTDNTTLSASYGFARLDTTDISPTRTAPSWRAGLTHNVGAASVSVDYGRSFMPSLGIGSTLEEKDLSGRFRMPLTRRIYTESSLTWRQDHPLSDDPLTLGVLDLKSVWFATAIGYEFQPWMHIQAFYSATHQNIDRAGGVINRNRIGFQIVTTKPMRIR